MTLFDEKSSPFGIFYLIPEWRFPIYLVSNCILTINTVSLAGLNAKVANDWFPRNEVTSALILPGVFCNILGASSSYLMPALVDKPEDLYIMAYFYIGLGVFYFIGNHICVTRSKPEYPPSEYAETSGQTDVSLLKGLDGIAKAPAIMMALMNFNCNCYILYVEYSVLANILSTRGFSALFAGQLMFASYIVGTFSSLLVASIDRFSSRWAGLGIQMNNYTCLSYAISFASFNLTLIYSTSEWPIMITHIMLSLTLYASLPYQLQVILVNSCDILPDATMVAVSNLTGTGINFLFVYMLVGLKQLSPLVGFEYSYSLPLIVYNMIIMLVNSIYFIFSKTLLKNAINHNN